MTRARLALLLMAVGAILGAVWPFFFDHGFRFELVVMGAAAGIGVWWAGGVLWGLMARWQNPFTRAFWRILWETIQNARAHNVSETAAGMAFYSLLAVVPLFIVLLSLLTYVLPSHMQKRAISEIDTLVSGNLPAEAAEVAKDQISSIITRPRVGLLSLSAVLMLWASSRLFLGVMRGLRRAMRQDRRRRFFVDRLQAMALTLIVTLLLAVGITMVVAGGPLMQWLILQLELDAFEIIAEVLLNTVRWVLIMIVMAVTVAVTYRSVDPRGLAEAYHITHGTALTIGGWIALNMGFRVYVHNFSEFNAVYGALGGVVILLIWLYLYGFVILLGAELNAVVTARRREAAEA